MKSIEQRGVVLIVVLWITILLTVLLVAFTKTIKVDRNVATDIVQRVQARASAEAVLNYLTAVKESDAYDLSEMVGQVYELTLNTMLVRFRFIPESSFLSLNAASVEDLEAVFNAAGADESLTIAQAIVQQREGGVDRQSGEYIAGKNWMSTAELLKLQSISPDVYSKVQSWFTVDSSHESVNFDFAESGLIQALKGVEAEQLLAGRTAQMAPSSDVGLTDDSLGFFRLQVELSSTKNKRKIEVSMAFDGGELGYRIARWNEYNAHFILE